MPPTPTETITFLGTRSPREIAGLLRDRKITGERGLALACPLARYVREVSGQEVRVGFEHWFNSAPGPLAATHTLPRTVRRFIEQFDAGRHPDLVAGAEPERNLWQRLMGQ